MIAVLPGSFDPPTYGHLDIIERSSRIFDSLHVLVAVNPRKKSLFTVEQKIKVLSGEIEKMKIGNVVCRLFGGLIVDYCQSTGIGLIVRGVRNSADFEYESEMARMNRHLNAETETVLMPANPNLVTFRSSSVKDILHFGGDISAIVPPGTLEILNSLINEKK